MSDPDHGFDSTSIDDAIRRAEVALHGHGHWILKDGEPYEIGDPYAWADWFERSYAERVVARTEVGPILVSTVYLGIDMALQIGPHRPLLWESAAFAPPTEGGVFGECLGMERYASKADALAGHARMVDLIRHRVGGEAP